MEREPVPPQASRGDALAQLQRELWHARNNGETRRVQELLQRIGRLRTDQDPGTTPQREDTAAAPPRRETTGAPTTAHRNRRSPRVPRK